ncbi:MAG: protein adenylyltransferase SelO family protein, partial [Pseudomonadota bacterium]
ACFAQAILPLLDDAEDKAVEEGQAAVNRYPDRFKAAYQDAFSAKIGLKDTPESLALAEDLLARMADNKADFTLTFRNLSALPGSSGPGAQEKVRALFEDPTAFDSWAPEWHDACEREGQDPHSRRAAMEAVNPAYIPRNHRVEEAISASVQGDFKPFETLMDVLSAPFEEQPEHAAFMLPPKQEERVYETFCGT